MIKASPFLQSVPRKLQGIPEALTFPLYSVIMKSTKTKARQTNEDTIPCKVGDSITFTISWSFGNGMRGEKVLSGGIINDTSDSIIFVGPDGLFPFDIYDKDGNKIH